MKLSRRTNTIILWIISIGLLVGMVITFTPTLGLGTARQQAGGVALRVNGEPVSELEVSNLRQNPVFSAVTEGQVGEDLRLLLTDTVVRQAVLAQAAARERVSNAEVRRAVNEFREARGVEGARNDNAYLQLIGSAGFDDQSFRDYMRQQLRQEKWEEGILSGATVTDEEVRSFYEAFSDNYRTEERIRAREIVVSDRELAEELRARAEAGESFAELAAEHSEERADRAGALGAAGGATEPQPVGRAALPTPVANAAFALRGPGLTGVVASNDRYYVVEVEEFVPSAVRPFEEVAQQVREDAQAAKELGLVEAELDKLVADAQVSVPADSTLTYDNPVVAAVGDREIRAADLARATYTDPQIQQFLTPDTAQLIADFFKPSVLEELIDRELALQGASEIDTSFVGTDAMVAEAALSYVARDAVATDEDLEEYYEANRAGFTQPASATVTQVEFPTAEAAEGFRSAVLGGTALGAAAELVGGEVTDLGRVGPGQLESILDTALFGTEAFEPLPSGNLEVSDVLVKLEEPSEEEPAEDGEDQQAEETAAAPVERYLVLVAERTAERVMPLAEVRDQVEAAVLNSRRAELRSAWLAGLRERIPVENLLLAQALPEEIPAVTDTDGAAAEGADAPAASDASESAEPEAETAAD